MPGALSQDVRYAWRGLRRTPGFTLAAVGALALGVGAVAAVGSLLRTVLLDPMGIRAPGDVVVVWERNASRGHAEVELSYPNYESFRDENRVFTGLAALPSVNFDVTLKGPDGPEQVEASAVSGTFFEVLGARPRLGRALAPADDTPGAPGVVVLSHGLWKRRFGGDAGVLGRTLTVDGAPATVVGVMPPDFDFPRGAQLWGPLHNPHQAWMEQRSFRVLRAVGRLRPGVPLEAARAGMEALAADLGARFPKENGGYGTTLVPLEESVFGSARPALWVLTAAVGLVLLIACANVANLLLARAAGRAQEVALRRALGAAPGRLGRQFLTEAALLGVLGTAAGLALGAAAVRALARLGPEDVPRLQDAALSPGVALATAAVALAVALLAGLAPALHAVRGPLTLALHEGAGTAGVGARGARTRAGLVAAEAALAVLLLCGAGLLLRTLQQLSAVDPGFEPRGVLSARLAPGPKHDTEPKRRALYTEVLARARALPGVTAAATVLMRPLSGTVGWDYPFTVEGQDAAAHAANPYSNYQAVSADYFGVMGIPLLQGRGFDGTPEGDVVTEAVVSASMARRSFPGGEAVGRRLRFGPPDSRAPWVTVVGVVGDARYREWEGVRPDVYVPMVQDAQVRTDLVLKVAEGTDPLSLAPALRRAVLEVDPDQPLAQVTTLQAAVDAALARPRFNALLLGGFAGVALVLATLGVYGVTAYATARRTRELGIRTALGAGRGDLVLLVLRGGLRLVALGAGVGLVLAVAGQRALAGLLYGVGPLDPWALGGALAVLGLAAVVACLVPARRAARVDPAVALRAE